MKGLLLALWHGRFDASGVGLDGLVVFSPWDPSFFFRLHWCLVVWDGVAKV